MVHINGKDVEADGITLNDYLIHNGYSLAIIAVEMNEKMISKSEYANVLMNSGDTVEIVNFVGGGWIC